MNVASIRALALDHAAEGIRVNAVCPGAVFTRFHEWRAQRPDPDL